RSFQGRCGPDRDERNSQPSRTARKEANVKADRQTSPLLLREAFPTGPETREGCTGDCLYSATAANHLGGCEKRSSNRFTKRGLSATGAFVFFRGWTHVHPN